MTHPVLARILEDFSPTATTFIVSIYGDVVAPRGEVLWMGNVIALCAGVGLCCTNRLSVRVPLSPDGLIPWLQ